MVTLKTQVFSASVLSMAAVAGRNHSEKSLTGALERWPFSNRLSELTRHFFIASLPLPRWSYKKRTALSALTFR
jgi:hypothetical protein